MVDQRSPIRVLVVGCGNMGASHATTYHNLQEFEICGLVSTGTTKEVLNNKLGGSYPLFTNYKAAMEATNPNTYEEFAIEALNRGCHVYIEKPLAETEAGAKRVAEVALKTESQVVVGYTKPPSFLGSFCRIKPRFRIAFGNVVEKEL